MFASSRDFEAAARARLANDNLRRALGLARIGFRPPSGKSTLECFLKVGLSSSSTFQWLPGNRRLVPHGKVF
jgi:hypothetical protein